jgi:hypothetical protein
VVRRPQLRRVRDGLLQQGPVQEVRDRRCRPRSTSSRPRWTSSSKGITPLAVGGAEYPAQQIFYELALSKADRAWVDDYQLYKNKVDFHGPAADLRRETFADWVKKGYIAKNSAGIKAEDMGVAFIRASSRS